MRFVRCTRGVPGRPTGGEIVTAQDQRVFRELPPSGTPVTITFAGGLELKAWLVGASVKRAEGVLFSGRLDISVLLPDNAELADRPFRERSGELKSWWRP